MIELQYIWVLILIPLPLLISRLLSEHITSKKSIKTPFFDDIKELTGTDRANKSERVSSMSKEITIWAAWLLLILTLSRPQIIEKPITKNIASRDLLLAIDLSGSMETNDFKNSKGKQVTRLDAVKEVISEFLKDRKGDRVSLIFFGSAAFIQMPFTEDLETCQVLLDEAQVRMAGPTTKIGDAIGLAISVFKRSEMKDKVLIMLTDGNDTGSQITPLKAAEIASDSKVVIHTVAVGDPTAAGEEELDEKTLKDIAEITNGRFFRASDRKGLVGIYEEIDRMGSRELETISHRPKRELFFWPLSLFFVLILSYHFIKIWKYNRAFASQTVNGGIND